MKNILLASHYTITPGPVNKFYDYLKEKYETDILLHPIFPFSDLKSVYQSGSKKISLKINPLLQFCVEGFYNLYFLKNKENKKIELAICFDPLCFIHLYFFKHFLGIKKIAYYNVDYSKKRYLNPAMDYIYKLCNYMAFTKSDYFFYINNMFLDDLDPNGKFSNKSFYVSHITNTKNIDVLQKKRKNSIIYAGSIDYNVDFDPLLQGLKKLREKNIEFNFDIFGEGRKVQELKEKIKKYNLTSYISIKGIVNNKEMTSKIQPQYMIGVSPYQTKKSPSMPDHAFLHNDLSAKIVDYISAGLPVVSTPLNKGFNRIRENELGFLVTTPDDWYNAIYALLTNKETYEKYKKNARKYSTGYDDEKVLRPIFEKILNNL